MIPIPPWPPASNAMWARAAQVVNALYAKCPENPFVVAALANGYMESALEPWAIGDSGTAFSIWQWHFNPRGALILNQTGIDVRSERSILKICDALWWELNSRPYAVALAMIRACRTANAAAQIFCLRIEGAGAADAAERRGLAADHLAAWVADNRAFIEEHPAT
jgi:Phage tail lysozyme